MTFTVESSSGSALIRHIDVVYDGALRGVNWASSDWRARWRTRLVLVRDFRLRRNELRSFTWMWIKRAAMAPDVTGARAVVQQFRDEQRAVEQAKRDAEERLRRYAGSNRTDTEGRRLDQREFKETTEALRFLATCQMGWYRNRGGRYHRETLLSVIGDDFTRHGLPKDHGIAVRFTKKWSILVRVATHRHRLVLRHWGSRTPA